MSTIKNLSALSATSADGTIFSAAAQRTTIIERTYAAFPRQVQLNSLGLSISRPGIVAQISMADIFTLVATYVPTLTQPPVIATQPSSASCVHSSTAATFTVIATSEITKTYQWQYNKKAVGTLTYDNVSGPADGDTVTVGGVVYTFKTALTPTAGQVLLNGGGDAALLNLIRAINHSGTAGTDYANLGTTAIANPQVSAATSVTSHAFAVTALTAGAAGNAIATTETSAHLTWGATTLTTGGWTSATGTINGCVYTNDTTATLTCTPTTTGQTLLAHRCAVTNAAGTNNTDGAAVLTIT